MRRARQPVAAADVPAPGVEGIVARFEESFEGWRIWFPRAGLDRRWEGEVNQAGWTILYQWGRTPRGEYLQVYAMHRMTNDRHFRLHEDGRADALPAPADCVLYPSDASEVERRRIRRKVEKQTTLAGEIFERTWSAQLRRIEEVCAAVRDCGGDAEPGGIRIEACGPIGRWRGVGELDRGR